MKFKKLLLNYFLLMLFFIPINIYAYSKYLIPGGENVGIKVNTKYVSIQGFYKVNNKYIGEDAGLKVGDNILEINNKKIYNIDNMLEVINNNFPNKFIKIKYLRNGKIKNTNLELIKSNDGIYKTGLYVKDSVSGIGTLTYIDPESKIFGALGHTILNRNNGLKLDINNGIIFDSYVTNINKSKNGNPGFKNANFNINDKFGNIIKNEDEGIFGNYVKEFNKLNLMEIKDIKDVKLGNAFIRTVIDGKNKEDFEINIINIDANNGNKNILFEIVDKDLLNLTGGVVAGMSGSPIIQDNKIIGAVTHVVVNDTKKGYGISIINMLEKGEEKN